MGTSRVVRLVWAEKVAKVAFGAISRLASSSINLTGAEGIVSVLVTAKVA